MPTTYESRRIAAPVASVWAAIADLEAASRWNRAWRRVEYLSDQREGEGTAFRAHTEDGLAHDFLISAWVPLERIAFAPVRDESEKRYMITLESPAFHLRPGAEGGGRGALPNAREGAAGTRPFPFSQEGPGSGLPRAAHPARQLRRKAQRR